MESGIFNLSTIEEQLKMAERKKYVEVHQNNNHTIWKDNKDRFCTCLPDPTKKDGRVIRRRKSKEEIEDVIAQYYKGQENNPTIEEVFNEWNDRRVKLRKIVPATHTRNRQIFRRFYSEFGKRKIQYVSPTEIEDFLEEQIPKFELTSKAFQGLKGVTKGFLLRAKKRKLITWDVVGLMNELDVSDKELKKTIVDDEKEVYYDDEMEAMLKYCQEHPETKNLGVALMFATGIRVGELVALKHEDFDGLVIDVKRGETYYVDPETDKYVWEVQERTKTAAGTREVVVPLKYKWIVDKLRLCNPFGEFVFTDEDGVRMNTNIIRKRVRKLCGKLGIQNKSPHKIRKTYGSILLDNKVDSKLIEKQMGHTDVLTTEIHYHRDRKRISQKMDVINSIPEFATNY